MYIRYPRIFCVKVGLRNDAIFKIRPFRDLESDLWCLLYVFKAQEKNEHQKRQNLIVVAVDQEVHFNIVSYHNINQKRYHQGMIDHVDDIDYTNGRILRDKNLL